jgi:hypothetical protein
VAEGPSADVVAEYLERIPHGVGVGV